MPRGHGRNVPFAQRARLLCLAQGSKFTERQSDAQRVSQASAHALPRDAAVLERVAPARVWRGCAEARGVRLQVRGTALAAQTTNVDMAGATQAQR